MEGDLCNPLLQNLSSPFIVHLIRSHACPQAIHWGRLVEPLCAAGSATAASSTAAAGPPLASDVEAAVQAVGVTRRKPGRGAPTLSMSCSDKLARWQALGLQVRRRRRPLPQRCPPPPPPSHTSPPSPSTPSPPRCARAPSPHDGELIVSPHRSPPNLSTQVLVEARQLMGRRCVIAVPRWKCAHNGSHCHQQRNHSRTPTAP